MTESLSKHTIVLAAGGTGGHIFPAVALAEELLTLGLSVALITDRRFADYYRDGGKEGMGQIPIHTIEAATMGRSFISNVRAVFAILRGVRQASRLLRDLKPQAVVGFGGYPSLPTMLAAGWRGIPTMIHEQNSVIGRANRVLARRVKCVATTYAPTARLPEGVRTQLTGNPVRAAVKALHDVPYPELAQDGTLRLLVIGGSQGASVFSRVVPEAIGLLPLHVRQRIRVDQQCRPVDLEATRSAYAALGLQADLASFFHDVPARLGAAHLVISRAGASSVAELTAAGRPAILVPFPHATDDHQSFNAQAVEDVGGGWVMAEVGFSAEALAARLESFLTLPSTLSKAAAQMRTLGRVNAARDLAALVLQQAKLNTGEALRARRDAREAELNLKSEAA